MQQKDEVCIRPRSEDRRTLFWPPPKPRPFAQSRFNEFCPTFSPDGHWLAYSTDESGRHEVYVQQYPGTGGNSELKPLLKKPFAQFAQSVAPDGSVV